MPLPQFSDLTPETAAELLAVESLLGQHRREKQANYPAFAQLGSQLKDGLGQAWQNLANPSNAGWESLRNGLIGAGVGGIGGVALDALDGDPNTNGGRGLHGAMVGGMLGGGGTLGLRGLAQAAKPTPSEQASLDQAKAQQTQTQDSRDLGDAAIRAGEAPELAPQPAPAAPAPAAPAPAAPTAAAPTAASTPATSQLHDPELGNRTLAAETHLQRLPEDPASHAGGAVSNMLRLNSGGAVPAALGAVGGGVATSKAMDLAALADRTGVIAKADRPAVRNFLQDPQLSPARKQILAARAARGRLGKLIPLLGALTGAYGAANAQDIGQAYGIGDGQ